MAESAKKKKTSSSSMMTDWSLLPEELLHIVSENLEDCFDIVHARSVCNLWRSTFPYPSFLLPQSYSLPSFLKFPGKSKDLCTLEKTPLFLFIAQTPPASAFMGGRGRDESERPSPIQCSVKVKIPGSDPTLMNMRDSHILAIGHQYRMIGCNRKVYRAVAFLPLNKEGGGREFIVLLAFSRFLLMLRSDVMRWVQVMEFTNLSCDDIVTYRDRFYATLRDKDMTYTWTLVIDPYSLDVSLMIPALMPLRSLRYLVPSGNDDELFCVEKVNSRTGVLDVSQVTYRVSRLDKEAGEWVQVSDLGDRVLFIGKERNVSCSAKELPDGCGVSGNSIIFTNEAGNIVKYGYKYSVVTGREEDDPYRWRFSGENRVTIFATSPPSGLISGKR